MPKSDFKVRQYQRSLRRAPGVFTRAHVNPDDPTVKRSCINKRKVDTRKEASRIAKQMTRKYGEAFNYYRCHGCGSHHVGGSS